MLVLSLDAVCRLLSSFVLRERGSASMGDDYSAQERMFARDTCSLPGEIREASKLWGPTACSHQCSRLMI